MFVICNIQDDGMDGYDDGNGDEDGATGMDGDTHEHMREHVCHMQIQA